MCIVLITCLICCISVNYLLTESLEIYHKIHNPEYTMTHGSLAETAKEISRRIVSIFKTGEQGYRPVHGECELQGCVSCRYAVTPAIV